MTLYGVLKLRSVALEVACNPAAECKALPAAADMMGVECVDLSLHPVTPS